jgi:hypothetical protein
VEAPPGKKGWFTVHDSGIKNGACAGSWSLTPVILTTWEAEIGRIAGLRASLHKSFTRSHLKNNQSKIDWLHGSSGRIPVLQAQSLEFKPQSHPKIKKNNNGTCEALLFLSFCCC